ncbi:MAG: tetratricopeptide repeat protein [Gaiellaceae bacterium]|jgi:tetratricopeptide (TPR) repeat protein
MSPIDEVPTDTAETLGQRLRRLRKEQGLSQQAISGPGLTTAHISRIEAGLRRPSVKAIRVLAKHLGVSQEYLETGRPLGPRGDLEVRIADAELELRVGTQTETGTEAIRKLVAEARSLGDPILTARAVAALGLTLCATASYAEATPLLEEATTSTGITPSLRPDVYIALAHAYTAVGRRLEAVNLLETALAFVDEHAHEHVGAYMRLAVNLSYALTDAGRLDEAREVLEQAVRKHGNDSDRRAQVSTYWTLARIAAMSGDSATALEHMRRAIALLEAGEDTLGLAHAYGLFGQILVVDGRFEEAKQPLARCVSALEREGRLEDLGLMIADQAKCAAGLGETDEAERLADRALQLLAQSPSDQGGALGALALVRMQRDQTDEAELLFERSVSLLEQGNEFAEASRVCRSWALMLRDQGRRDEAAALLGRAAELEKRPKPHSLQPG